MSDPVKINLEVEAFHEMTMQDLAILIWGLGSDQQAELFDRLGEIDQHKLDTQFLSAADECSGAGLNFMRTLGECNLAHAATHDQPPVETTD